MNAANNALLLQEQSPAAVVMIRPLNFLSNPETAADNTFQNRNTSLTRAQIATRAFSEVSEAAEELRKHGVKVHLFDDTGSVTPDSVFPNNWFSTHADGRLAIYSMYSPNRRKERRGDIIDMVKAEYRVEEMVDYSHFEQENLFLEGTGSMVLDHVNRIAYAARSKRMDEVLLHRFCEDFNFEAMAFNACDENGVPVYHTNVLMSIGTGFAVIGAELIPAGAERDQVLATLRASGRDVIQLSNEQINHFAGNVLELSTAEGKVLALSSTAHKALTEAQKAIIEKHARFAVLDVPTIELAGGSVRCMLAGIHLTRR